MVDQQLIKSWVRVALKSLGTEFPYAAHHVSRDVYDTDVSPRRLHPSFHGCFDWHSSVHMQWSLVRMLTVDRLALDQAQLTGLVCDLLDARLTPAKIETEVDYLQDHVGFERPYGWAWAAMLGSETWRCLDRFADPWVEATSELVACIADLIIAFLPRLGYPVRHGAHANTAFSLSLMHHAFTVIGRTDVVELINDYARQHYGADRAAPLAYEPSGTDFLSPALSEAELMLRVLGPEFPAWLERFLPALGVPDLPDSDHPCGEPELDRLLNPLPPEDTADGQLAHLTGLALSKSWQLSRIAASIPAQDHRHSHLVAAAINLREPALPLVAEAHYASTHWLVTFALLATDI